MTKDEYDAKRGNTYKERLDRKIELEMKARDSKLGDNEMFELMACPSCGMLGQFHFEWCEEIESHYVQM